MKSPPNIVLQTATLRTLMVNIISNALSLGQALPD